ncbi:hypothetical protein [Williamsia sp. DF01-3]|uniref:hypothetical protein n=1 Tax=Williamsia sp. DF01-3 TaxID=2934157 RepID=UPI001FF4CEA7|nr:hypothetical protein [Williamsia sp. DF01-3]MCK0517322.1 hypothetical protein [Williamsia sp. DF01-3]
MTDWIVAAGEPKAGDDDYTRGRREAFADIAALIAARLTQRTTPKTWTSGRIVD